MSMPLAYFLSSFRTPKVFSFSFSRRLKVTDREFLPPFEDTVLTLRCTQRHPSFSGQVLGGTTIDLEWESANLPVAKGLR